MSPVDVKVPTEEDEGRKTGKVTIDEPKKDTREEMPSALSVASALGLSDTETIAEIQPLMRKKTSVIENMDANRKLAEEQFIFNQELLAKNQELEERLAALEGEFSPGKDE